MNPSIDVRIDSLIRALSDFVIPELPPGGTGADQAGLVVAHLQVLRGQIDLAGSYERYELEHATGEARALLAAAEGGEKTTRAARSLTESLSDVDDHAPAFVRASTEAVRAGIDILLRSAAEDGDPGVTTQFRSIVITYERALADTDRSLFADNGWESGTSELPDLQELLKLA